MRDTANANSRELLDVMAAYGVRDVVLSPGSRNTPLLVGVSARPGLMAHLINDERTAGFMALGMAIASRRPVAMICTSGTALYNYAPAVAEAFYQKIPLIVITADRPRQWIDQDDSQTLHQHGALEKIVKGSYDIPPEECMTSACANPQYSTEREWYVNRIANEALLTATCRPAGPVHINMQFGEPLNGEIEADGKAPRIIRVIENYNSLPPHKLREICEYLLTKRVMVVAGFMPPDHNLNRALVEFSKFPNVTLLCETISNLHLEGDPYMIDSLLVNMSEQEKRELAPDVVITIGGALVSRMLKEYLRGSVTTEHWTLNDTSMAVDCLQRLSTHVEVSPTRFFKGVSGMNRYLIRKGTRQEAMDYSQRWSELRRAVRRKVDISLHESPWSEYKALGVVFASIPQEYNLFLSNGTCIRYAQLLMSRIPHGCYCNRGVSGIDGTNATAAGIAEVYGGTTLLVTGDMSFSYCTEILNPAISKGDLRIVFINNAGGGIFRFIKTTRSLEQREKFFCNSPELPLKSIAEAYGHAYRKAKNETELAEALKFLYSTPRAVIEIEADPQESAEVLRNILTPAR